MKRGHKRIAWQAKTNSYHIIALRFGLPPQATDGKCIVIPIQYPRIKHLRKEID